MSEWVYLDLDGTLVDSIPLARSVFQRFLHDRGAVVGDVEFEMLNGRSLDEIAAWIREVCVLEDDVVTIRQDYDRALKEAGFHDAAPIEGAGDLLEALSTDGRPTALVTAAPRVSVTQLLERLGWTASFRLLVTGDDVASAKPDPALFLAAIERSGGDPSASVAVEDSVNGVRAASAAGLRVVGLCRHVAPALLSDAGADTVVATLGEVRTCLGLPAGA